MSAGKVRAWARRRWRRLWRELGSATAPLAVLDALLAAYAERHRAYHDLAHVRACLRELDAVSASAAHPEEVEVALWFHDAIYDPRREDNEERSAEWAMRTLREQDIEEATVRRVGDMIRATRHHSSPRTADEALLLDIDLAILGSNPAAFRRYDEGIRSEYSWVPEEPYRTARTRVLAAFLERDPIYQTAAMRERFETSARRNLTAALAHGELDSNPVRRSN
jgi:predicted metal-dependent HD superfamily phosphohydrolase